MNRENYDRKVLTTFNVIGCYFVNHYYNSHYRRANHLHKKYGRSSLTDEYKHVITVYNENITSKEIYYKEMVLDLHKYYQSTTRTTSLLGDFTNRILGHFLPEEHLGIMTDTERSFFLSRILGDIITDFTIYVSEVESLRGIIDNHTDRANTRKWLDRIIDIQMLIRERLYRDFVRKGRGQTVDLETFQKLQEDRDKLMDKLREVVAELVLVKTELSNAKKIVEHLTNENSKLAGGVTMCDPVPSVEVVAPVNPIVSRITGAKRQPRPPTPPQIQSSDDEPDVKKSSPSNNPFTVDIEDN